MASTGEDEDTPQRRKPLLVGTGWLLFVCAFLPTLRVCGDPVSPYEFPPSYVVYLGAAVFAVLAVVRSLRARRAWFTTWYVLWFVTAIAWAAMFIADANETMAVIAIIGGIVGVVVTALAFHQKRFTPRGMWIGAIVHGAISIAWYLLLASDSGAVWGAFAGLIASVAFAIAAVATLGQHAAELERRRRETEPAPLPVARVVPS